ncbi:unsaturated rhamnogalacturonyl hydrolase [Alteromonadaceae bacterium Bs31]|nr:unsaturated rhamnogalacturonyl hydrolase [Alteromonadaceae bacterium Bs31]
MIRLFFLFVPLLSVMTNASPSVGTSFADAIIQRYQPTIDVVTHHGWDHSNSVVLHGMEKVYKVTGKREYLQYIQGYADTFVKDDGSIEGLLSTLDGLHPGTITLFLYQQTGEKKYLQATRNMRDHLLKGSTFNKTPNGAYWHKNVDKYKNVATVDGLYMVYPFLVHYGVVAKDQVAIDAAAEQILLVSERSFSIKYGLPFHGWNYDKSKSWANPVTGTSSQFWSRASGWFSMALVDVLEYLPENHPSYQKILFLYQSLAEGLSKQQDPDTGFWYHVLDARNEKNNYPESSATGMIVYSLSKGVELGLLDKRFAINADKGWQALQSKITTYSDGGPQLHSIAPGMGVQDNFKAYLAIRPVSIPSTQKKQHMHGYMSVLMAASQMEK